MRTFSPTPNDIDRVWHVVDADGMVLGRLATEV
ncbi:MAG: 50S ribosomal protein L13, partial [Acidimicrobiia bacterium]